MLGEPLEEAISPFSLLDVELSHLLNSKRREKSLSFASPHTPSLSFSLGMLGTLLKECFEPSWNPEDWSLRARVWALPPVGSR